MSNSSQASQRIAALLDDNSFVEIGAKVTARATDFNMKPTETPSDGVVTGCINTWWNRWRNACKEDCKPL